MLESEGKNLLLNQNETSNYASAESSPNGSMIASPSSHSLRSNISLHADETVKSKLSQSISISSLLGTNKSLSVHPSLDDPSIVVPTTLACKLVPSSTSTNALDKLLKQGEFCSLNSAEFQSLPPNILMSHAKSANELEKDLLNDSLKQKSESQTIHDLVKSTVSNLIESTVKTSIEEMTKEVQQEKEKNLATKLMPSLFPSVNTVSSSSPNPITSPFKYLMTDVDKQHAQIPKSPSQSIKTAATLSPNGSTIQDAVSIFNAEQTKLNSSSVIEKLAQLNHKEHEKEDPILSASNIKDSKKMLVTPGITPSNSQILNQPIKQSNSNHSMTVPDSSQEFCRNLNLNLAAAAANIAQVPLVVSEPINKETVTEHQRFTSNASTSSIHNDLKAILEGGKQEPKEDGCKLDKQKESPKPQREKLNRSKTTKNKTESKNDDLMKLVSMMKQMSENKDKPGQQIGGDESGHFRYTNEFLQQIRKERSGFIENIQPEIFKAYCYCMSGKYWDPEKYFDIIQYSGDYERVVQQNQQQQLKNQNNQNHHGKKNVKKNSKSTKKTITNNDANNNIKENILGHLGLGKNKEDVKQADKILLDLLKKNQEVNKEETKQVNLMDMLNQKKTKNSNILGELFNQNQSGQNAPKHHPVILTAQELELSQINRPVNRLFTNLNKTPDVANKLTSPNSCGSNSCTSECSSANSDNANNSEAYKQLIKNLSNHPLCTPSTASTRSPMENVFMKLQKKTSESEQNVVAKESTNLLKQLLHLNPEESDKKQKPKRHHHHHRKSLKQDDKQVSVTSVESTVTTTTTTTITQTQFPSVNPHEKPSFQTTSTNNKQQQQQQQEKPIQNQIENLFNKMKMTNLEPVKVEAKKSDEKEHFNSLLNKIIVKPQQQQVKKESENILKWFSGLNQQQLQKPNFSARTLSEIELMSGHFP
ncbi:unnamed protein product [Brachionus calyciflorus]|uniref:Uncharacterized protein n=1 Tax=Brachionus calyciflorus TaxID=104777 RepID=A0A813WAH1_9BILA|nr:unnamed protein product [Brachionus calyciflorus]